MKTVKYFYDCEFLEDGYTVDLISIGMATEEGREFYAVSTEFDTRRVAKNEWLMDNVMSSIGHNVIMVPSWESSAAVASGFTIPLTRDLEITDPAAMTRNQIRDGILEFTEGTWPDFWAWYGAYDHVALCQLFGKMIDLPKRFPMFTSDIKQDHKRAGSPPMPKQPEGLHNALADAKWNIVRYNYLQGLINGR